MLDKGAVHKAGAHAQDRLQRQFSRNLAQPFDERNAETLLLTRDNRGRQKSTCDFLEKIFALPVAQLETARQPPAEFYEVVIEKYRPRFQRAHHGGAVDFHQNVVLQIEAGEEL